MEKYLKLLFIALFATMSFSLTSCGDDDEDEPATKGSILGAWKYSTIIDEDWWMNCYLYFTDDGVVQTINVLKFPYDEELDIEKESSTWSVSGDKVIAGGEVFPIVSLTDSKMVVRSDVGIEVTYIKVPDSEVEPYL